MVRFFFVKILLMSFTLVDVGLTKMILKAIEHCEMKDYPMSFNIGTYFENDKQFMNGNATLKKPLTNDIKGKLRVDLVVEEMPIPIVNVTERGACNVLHKYFGEFAYDIERAASLTPGLCPIPKGKYRITHHSVDLEKITIRGFPVGLLRLTIGAIDKNNEVVACLKADLDNIY